MLKKASIYLLGRVIKKRKRFKLRLLFWIAMTVSFSVIRMCTFTPNSIAGVVSYAELSARTIYFIISKFYEM